MAAGIACLIMCNTISFFQLLLYIAVLVCSPCVSLSSHVMMLMLELVGVISCKLQPTEYHQPFLSSTVTTASVQNITFNFVLFLFVFCLLSHFRYSLTGQNTQNYKYLNVQICSYS